MYDYVVAGSGYVSAGFVKSHSNSVFIDRGELLDKYFCGAFNQGQNWDKEPKGKETKKFHAYLKSLNIIRDDKADIASLETAFCSFLKDSLPDCLLLTEIVDIKKENDVFTVTVYNNNGFSAINAKHIIVNTPFKDEKFVPVRFRADENEVKNIFPSSICENGFYLDEIYAYIPAQSDSIAEEKMRITNDWCAGNVQGKIIYFAPEFKYEGKEKIRYKDGITYVDESAFENALSAYDFGGEIK